MAAVDEHSDRCGAPPQRPSYTYRAERGRGRVEPPPDDPARVADLDDRVAARPAADRCDSEPSGPAQRPLEDRDAWPATLREARLGPTHWPYQRCARHRTARSGKRYRPSIAVADVDEGSLASGAHVDRPHPPPPVPAAQHGGATGAAELIVGIAAQRLAAPRISTRAGLESQRAEIVTPAASPLRTHRSDGPPNPQGAGESGRARRGDATPPRPASRRGHLSLGRADVHLEHRARRDGAWLNEALRAPRGP
ncbi:hypothetical protein BH20ACT19_BH20ACT19_11840 [soil metagenome]